MFQVVSEIHLNLTNIAQHIKPLVHQTEPSWCVAVWIGVQ